MSPLIGITTAVRHFENSDVAYCVAYTIVIEALERAGALPVLIPSNVSDSTLQAIYARLEGILLPGGGDIDPKYFDEAPHPATGEIDPHRDRTEVQLAQWAMRDDLPIFGICRGHQVLNVAMGGALIQDIPSQLEAENIEPHALPDGTPRVHRSHSIALDASSKLAAIIGTTHVDVNSIHHQSVKTPAPGFVVTATSPDGVIEATEMPDKRFALSVQWHPEDLSTDDGQMQALFNHFVAACIARRNGN